MRPAVWSNLSPYRRGRTVVGGDTVARSATSSVMSPSFDPDVTEALRGITGAGSG
jgi:hypothetical protein